MADIMTRKEAIRPSDVREEIDSLIFKVGVGPANKYYSASQVCALLAGLSKRLNSKTFYYTKWE